MIKIEDLIPLLREGWVAMDANGEWWWYEERPFTNTELLQWYGEKRRTDKIQDAFDIEPAEDWTQSLIKIERKDK